MDYKYVHEEIRLIYEHVNSGRVDPGWLATHCEILSHYASTLHRQETQGTFYIPHSDSAASQQTSNEN